MRTMLPPPHRTKRWLLRASLKRQGQAERCGGETSAARTNTFGHCLSDTDARSTSFLLEQLVGIGSVGERLPVVLELMEADAEPVLRHVHVHSDKLEPQLCVLRRRLEFSLSISQPLRRFPRNQFPRAVVADARAPKSCRESSRKRGFQLLSRAAAAAGWAVQAGRLDSA